MNRSIALGAVLGLSLMAAAPVSAQDSPTSIVNKLGVDQDVRSGQKILMDEILSGSLTFLDDDGATRLGGNNVQANVPSGDYIQQFPGFRPFVHATQSEVSTAAFDQHVVLGYNNSAGLHVSTNPSGPGLIVDRVRLSGFAASSDGGKTWTNGFLPPSHGANQTFGDPSVGVDRHGAFYYATLGADALGRGTVQVNTSHDGGGTWSEGVIVQQDDASDKEWLAVGPGPANRHRDNVYVTWTSFQTAACELRFGRSTDGGATWTAKTIFVPTSDPNPAHPQNCLQFSNPVVDRETGTLYVPFLRFSNADQDFIQMMISDDAGDTFHFATFNAPGAPSPTVLPVTQPGEATACGGTNIRLTMHGTLNAGPGRFGFPRYVNASRLTLQPAAAARHGVVYLAWNNSQSSIFGSSAGSDVWYLRSHDGGQTWSSPMTVNPIVATDTHHVLPSLAMGEDSDDVHISYYTQHTDSTIDLDMASSDDGAFPPGRTMRITSASFHLPPTNIARTNAPSFLATNFDRLIAVCYSLGEYHGVTATDDAVYVGWGDARNQITEPVNALDPISGQTHPQQDVFFQKVRVGDHGRPTDDGGRRDDDRRR